MKLLKKTDLEKREMEDQEDERRVKNKIRVTTKTKRTGRVTRRSFFSRTWAQKHSYHTGPNKVNSTMTWLFAALLLVVFSIRRGGFYIVLLV